MDKKPFSKKVFLASIGLSLAVLAILLLQSFLNTKTRIVFCNVGQGDGAYIRTKDRIDIVIDAGRDRSILNCLGKYMPFYDRTIELAFLSHPQFDHYEGYNYIVDRYHIQTFVTNAVDNNNKSYNLLKSKLKSHNVQIKNLYSGDGINLSSEDKISFVWPSQKFVSSNIDVLGVTTADLNDFSEMLVFSEGDFDALFTGDIMLNKLITPEFSLNNLPGQKIEILKVPHHGSKNGLTEDFLQKIDPEVSIISVGKNSYGHPSPEILDMFSRLHKKYLRTDKMGDIVVEVDEKGWRITNPLF